MLEFPHKIKYDFLLLLFGLGLWALAVFIFLNYSDKFKNGTLILILYFLIVFGLSFIITSVGYIQRQFQDEQALKTLEFSIQKYNKVKTLYDMGLITKFSLTQYEKTIKEEINYYKEETITDKLKKLFKKAWKSIMRRKSN